MLTDKFIDDLAVDAFGKMPGAARDVFRLFARKIEAEAIKQGPRDLGRFHVLEKAAHWEGARGTGDGGRYIVSVESNSAHRPTFRQAIDAARGQ